MQWDGRPNLDPSHPDLPAGAYLDHGNERHLGGLGTEGAVASPVHMPGWSYGTELAGRDHHSRGYHVELGVEAGLSMVTAESISMLHLCHRLSEAAARRCDRSAQAASSARMRTRLHVGLNDCRGPHARISLPVGLLFDWALGSHCFVTP
jgi:hypothetical protein